jgi:TrmH family RNA methyltransferase
MSQDESLQHPSLITSLQNERVKLAHALQTSAKARRKAARIALEGARLIADALANGYRPDFILHDPDFYAADVNAPPDTVWLPAAPEVMRHVCATEQPQGALGIFPLPNRAFPTTLTRALILDGVRDPGNMGAILRAAAAAGVDGVLCSPDCVDLYNPKALRAGMGAHFRVPSAEKTWDTIRAACAGLAVYLADMDGEIAYDQVDWRTPHALIIGGEAHGGSAESYGLATARVSIPMAAHTESLNAGAAAAVLLFESARQRRG